MKRLFERILRSLKAPPIYIVFSVYILSFVIIGVTLFFLTLDLDGILLYLSYLMYALSALALSYSVYLTVRFAPRIKSSLIGFLMKNPLTARFLTHYGARTFAIASFTLALNIAYAAFCAIIAILSQKPWYGVLAAYYILLTFMRGGIVFYHGRMRKNSEGDFDERQRLDWKKYKTTGALLMLLPLSLSFAIVQMVKDTGGYKYGSIMIYAVAAYTFWKVTMSVINIFKAKKSSDFIVMAVRNIGLADALVSLLSLQNALIRAFGNPKEAAFANAATGAAVCAATFSIGLLMIIRKEKND